MASVSAARARPAASAERPRWRIRPSARARILGWYIVLVALALAVGLFVQRTILLSQLDDEVDDQMAQEVEELRQLSSGRDPSTGQPFGRDARAIFDTFLRRNIPVAQEALFTIVGGEPYLSTVSPVQLLDDPEVVSLWAGITEPTKGSLDTEEGEARYLAVPVMDESETAGVFVVAIFMEERREDVSDVIRVGALVFGSSFLVASVLAWVAAGRVLRPVRLLTNTARSITDENWSERIPVRGDDELVELTRTFNDMLDRLEAAFGAQRQFIDDAGHELRTPITIIRGHLELLDDAPEPREETLRLVMDELDNMTRMVEDLLLLAKTEAPDFLSLQTVDVAELTEQVAARASAIGSSRWTVEEVARVRVVADPQRLSQALLNLLRNAVEHTPQGTPVRIGSRVEGESVLLWVTDSGPGIPLAEQSRVFERFARGRNGSTTGDGAGLGLAIVRAIAEAHGGSATLQSAPGEGASFVIAIPIDGPEGVTDATHPHRRG